MEAFSDALVLASLTLLAIIVAIFVLAASLLGRAIQQAREEQQAASAREQEEAEAQATQLGKAIAEVQSKLKEAATSEAVSTLEGQLSQYKKERKTSEKQSKKAARRHHRYRALTVQWGILPTSMLVLASLVLAAAAQPVTAAAGYALLSVCGLFLLGACYRIYQSLRVVQEIAVTTEEAQFKREVEAFETALVRLEERKRPILSLKFIEAEPPFKFKPSSQQVIQFHVSLIWGDAARSTRIDFIAPEGFDFPGHEPYRRSLHVQEFPGALTAIFQIGDVLRDMTHYRKLNITAPATPGTYTLNYWLGGEGCIGRFEPFEVEIAE